MMVWCCGRVLKRHGGPGGCRCGFTEVRECGGFAGDEVL